MMDVAEEFEPQPLPTSESTNSLAITSDQGVPDDNDVLDTERINHLSYDSADGSATPDVAALYRAVSNLDVNAVESIVKSGVDVNCTDAKFRYSNNSYLIPIQLENEICNLKMVVGYLLTVVFLSQTNPWKLG